MPRVLPPQQSSCVITMTQDMLAQSRFVHVPGLYKKPWSVDNREEDLMSLRNIISKTNASVCNGHLQSRTLWEQVGFQHGGSVNAWCSCAFHLSRCHGVILVRWICSCCPANVELAWFGAPADQATLTSISQDKSIKISCASPQIQLDGNP